MEDPEKDDFLKNIKVEREKFGVLFDFLKEQGVETGSGGMCFSAAEDVIEYAGTLAMEAAEESKRKMDSSGTWDIAAYAAEYRNYNVLRAKENAFFALYRLMPRGKKFLEDVLNGQGTARTAGKGKQPEGKRTEGKQPENKIPAAPQGNVPDCPAAMKQNRRGRR